MADSTRAEDTTDSGTPRDGDTGSTRPHAANARVAQLRGGLEKAVSGREALIKSKAVEFAEKIDTKTGGRHHQKLRVALMVVDFVVDRVGGSATAGTPSGGAGAKGKADPSGSGRTRSAEDEPEHLGEFRNVSDR